jgi:TPR repeat protein
LMDTAQAEKRIALVVGNSAYKNVARLDNPRNDAALMARTLKDLGFILIGGDANLDLDKTALDAAIQKFGQQVQGADVALFYYAGHGIQLRGSNYLVPIDANPAREADVDFQMVDMNLVMRQMEGSGTRLNLVIIDACRNNPFGGRGLRAMGGGLAQMDAPDGTLISYATQPGNIAEDGAGGNSPYTTALAATIRRPGLDIFQTFNEVGLAVKRTTGGAQQPWVSSSPIDGNFYFAGSPIAIKPDIAEGGAKEKRSGQSTDPLRLDLITDCDRLAANPMDPQKPKGVAGVPTAKIDIVAALAACRDAMRQFPEVARFTYQAGRIATAQKDYLHARQLYEQAASMGSAAGMNNLGLMYRAGNGVGIDYAEAHKLFAQAADGGFAPAVTNIGLLVLEGKGVNKDPAEARKWFERAAAGGDGNGMTNLGLMYLNGLGGLSKNDAQAMSWFRKAADAGDGWGMTNLGLMYESGRGGLPKDDTQAASWFRKAADAGHGRAMVQLGLMYENGRGGLSKDDAQAVRWYRQAADAGDGRGMANLGRMYENGLGGLSKNDAQAVSWLRQAADIGDGWSMTELGGMYESGRGGLPKDETQAASWFRKAANAGQGAGMTNLGLMYENGRGGLPKDDAQAMSWYRQAADAGDGRGMASLGYMYATGRGGLSKDEAQAANWFRKAADAGDEIGMANLALMYEKGLGGLPKDEAQAVSWYRKAAQLGNSSAKDALTRLGR